MMKTSHRPWPVPNKGWNMKQNWHDLLFAHWPIDKEVLQKYIPNELEIDTFDGEAWIGVVPFHMSGIRHRYLPPIPTAYRFAEINVRTYVVKNGIPGVYFFSLDAASKLAVKAARLLFSLPYFYANISFSKEKGTVHYDSKRLGTNKAFHFKGSYKPTSSKFNAKPGSLDYWLTERYCLYTIHKNQLFRSDILHEPWNLQHAEAEIVTNSMIQLDGFSYSKNKPILHYVEYIEVLLWGLEKDKEV